VLAGLTSQLTENISRRFFITTPLWAKKTGGVEQVVAIFKQTATNFQHRRTSFYAENFNCVPKCAEKKEDLQPQI